MSNLVFPPDPMDDPKRIKVLGKTWLVLPTYTDDDHGECSPTRCEITLLQNQNFQQKQDTLLHEVIHAIDFTLDINLTENQTHALAGGLYAVLHDNKHFVKWLLKENSDGKDRDR